MRKVLLSDRSLQLLFGPLDENIRFLENLFNVTIQTRDSSLIIDGEEANVAALERILIDFSALVDKGHSITNGDLKSAFKQIAEDAALSLHDFFPKMQLLTNGKRQVTPKSLNQRRYIEAIRKNDIVFGIGPGGTGKTFLAMAMALTYLLEKSVSRIILTRPAVEAGEQPGVSSGRYRRENQSLPAPALRCFVHSNGRGKDQSLHREWDHRNRPAGFHARAHAERRLYHPGRGPEHDVRTDENVPDPHRSPLKGSHHGRRYPD